MAALPDTTALILEPRGSVLTIWLNRPEVKNALSADMVAELSAVLDASRDDRSLRTIILRAGDFIDTSASGNWFDMIMTKNGEAR